MVAMLITLVVCVPAYVFFSEGKETDGWICVGIIAAVWFFRILTVDNDRAFVNLTNYWSRRRRKAGRRRQRGTDVYVQTAAARGQNAGRTAPARSMVNCVNVIVPPAGAQMQQYVPPQVPQAQQASRQIQQQAAQAPPVQGALAQDTGSLNRTAVCHYCGRYVQAGMQAAVTEDGMMRTYVCPRCGKRNYTKLG